ncbi:MAG: hypothetical protein JWO65_1656 [Sphingomonas bacterium]|nr:hypothetical protein [Sphingomonas bacterium]
MHYRIYGLSDVSGRIVAGGDLLVETDEEAIRLGCEMYSNAAFEIWCKDRRVFTQGLMTKHAGKTG